MAYRHAVVCIICGLLSLLTLITFGQVVLAEGEQDEEVVSVTATPCYITLPTVSSSNATDITSTTAILHGNITNIGSVGQCGKPHTRGFEWGFSTGEYPLSWNETGSFGVGEFERTVEDLDVEQHVFWRAFAINDAGTGYSSERDFWTLGIPLAPTNFTLIQVGVNAINITWEKGPGANHTIVIGSDEGCPDSIEDGYVVYNGTGTSVVMEGLTLSTVTYCFKAWSWNSHGYSNDYAEGSIGGRLIMAISLFILALGLTGLSFWKRSIVFALGSSLSWVAVGIILLVSPGTIGFPAISESWVQVLAYLFFLMAAGCLIWYIAGIGKIKITRTDTDAGRAWVEYGKPPVEQKPSRSQRVKEGYRDRIRNAIRKGRGG